MINMKDKIKREVILMNLIAIDIGGTTIKIATWINQKLKMAFTIDTPDNLDTFYEELTDAVNEIKANHNIDGVAISSPGAVNKATGVIEGASALPYIHNFKIVPELEKRFGLPVSIENDANCAALAEIADGAAKGCSSMAFLVIGTGVGGSIIINNQIWHGAHLYGGEFGFMIIDGKQLSELASPVTMAKRYNKKLEKILMVRPFLSLLTLMIRLLKKNVKSSYMLLLLQFLIFNTVLILKKLLLVVEFHKIPN